MKAELSLTRAKGALEPRAAAGGFLEHFEEKMMMAKEKGKKRLIEKMDG